MQIPVVPSSSAPLWLGALLLASVGARPNKLLSLEPPHRATRRMNKPCSRNTGLATAVERSAHGSLGLAVFSPFDVLVPFHPVPFIIPLLSLFLSLRTALFLYVCFSFSAIRTGIFLSLSFFLTLSLSLGSFRSEPCSTNLFAFSLLRFVSSSLQSMLGVSSFLPRSLLRSLPPPARVTLRLAAVASRSVHGISSLAFLPRSTLRARCQRPNKYQINETAARSLDVLITGV